MNPLGANFETIFAARSTRLDLMNVVKMCTRGLLQASTLVFHDALPYGPFYHIRAHSFALVLHVMTQPYGDVLELAGVGVVDMPVKGDAVGRAVACAVADAAGVGERACAAAGAAEPGTYGA